MLIHFGCFRRISSKLLRSSCDSFSGDCDEVRPSNRLRSSAEMPSLAGKGEVDLPGAWTGGRPGSMGDGEETAGDGEVGGMTSAGWDGCGEVDDAAGGVFGASFWRAWGNWSGRCLPLLKKPIRLSSCSMRKSATRTPQSPTMPSSMNSLGRIQRCCFGAFFFVDPAICYLSCAG